MKRLILLLIVAGLIYWVWARERNALMRPATSGHRNGPYFAQDRETRKQLAKAGRDVKRALRDAEHQIRHTVDKTHDEVHRAIAEVRGALRSGDDDDAEHEQDDVAQSSIVERQEADGLPVPIVPGTRVTDAQAVPPVPPVPPAKAHGRVDARRQPRAIKLVAGANNSTEILDGQISATPERAANQAREDLRKHIAAWLDPEVPSSWKIPDGLMDSIVLNSELESVPHEFGLMYITHLKLDKAPQTRARFVKVYNHEVVGRRLVNMGGSLAFVLVCLAAVSGYIRADEATKGYYTNRLRTLAAAGVGAGGVLIYQMLT
jgi:hypothetical protein